MTDYSSSLSSYDMTEEDMTVIPQCFIRWCTSNLPATHSIPIRPGSENYVRVCDNCYYDFAFEGISIYSWTDEQLWSRNMSEEERARLYRKLDRHDYEE
jgi:hypothetical protein